MKVEEYILAEAEIVEYGISRRALLEPGAFVKPIQYCYLPRHVKENKMFQAYSLEMYVFCFTYYGIVPIHRKNIVRV